MAFGERIIEVTFTSPRKCSQKPGIIATCSLQSEKIDLKFVFEICKINIHYIFTAKGDKTTYKIKQCTLVRTFSIKTASSARYRASKYDFSQ